MLRLSTRKRGQTLSNVTTTLTIECIEDFRQWLSDEERSRSASTIKAYSSDIRSLFRDLEVNSFQVEDLPILAARWLTQSTKDKIAPTTIRRRRASILALKEFLGFEGDVLTRYKMPPVAEPVPHPLPRRQHDINAMLDACANDEQRALVALLGCEGLRMHEALDLEVRHIDLTDMSIHVWGKGSKVRVIPLTVKAFTYLAPQVIVAQLSGSVKLVHYSDRGARSLVTELGVKAKVSRPVSSHDLRATFATVLYEQTKDILLLKRWLGHSDINTTQRYIGLTWAEMTERGNM